MTRATYYLKYSPGMRVKWKGALGTVASTTRVGSTSYARVSIDNRNGLPYWVEFSELEMTNLPVVS